MAKGFTTINVGDDLKISLRDLADKVARREGLSRVSMAQLIERMKKVYEDTVEL